MRLNRCWPDSRWLIRKNHAQQSVRPQVGFRQFIYLACAHTLLCTALVHVFIFAVPDFEKIFIETKVALPGITALFLRISGMFTQYGIIIVPALWGMVLFGDIIVYTVFSGDRNCRLRRAYAWISVLLFGALYALVIFSIVFPAVKLA